MKRTVKTYEERIRKLDELCKEHIKELDAYAISLEKAKRRLLSIGIPCLIISVIVAFQCL